MMVAMTGEFSYSNDGVVPMPITLVTLMAMMMVIALMMVIVGGNYHQW